MTVPRILLASLQGPRRPLCARPAPPGATSVHLVRAVARPAVHILPLRTLPRFTTFRDFIQNTIFRS